MTSLRCIAISTADRGYAHRASRFHALPHGYQRGVSLIEVLVAVVVLSIGLLGLAGLQASGLRVGQSSIYRSQAAQLAYDMVERMRVNIDNASSYDDEAKSRTTRVELDLRDWRLRLQQLPGGTGSIMIDQTPERTLATVVVQWDDTRGADVLREDSNKAEREKLRASRFSLTTRLRNCDGCPTS